MTTKTKRAPIAAPAPLTEEQARAAAQRVAEALDNLTEPGWQVHVSEHPLSGAGYVWRLTNTYGVAIVPAPLSNGKPDGYIARHEQAPKIEAKAETPFRALAGLMQAWENRSDEALRVCGRMRRTMGRAKA